MTRDPTGSMKIHMGKCFVIDTFLKEHHIFILTEQKLFQSQEVCIVEERLPREMVISRYFCLICDFNQRVMCWPCRSSSHQKPEIVIKNIYWNGLIMDKQGSLYVSNGSTGWRRHCRGWWNRRRWGSDTIVLSSRLNLMSRNVTMH